LKPALSNRIRRQPNRSIYHVVDTKTCPASERSRLTPVLQEEERDKGGESTIHGNISSTWHGCSWAVLSCYSSPCIFHTLLLFQCQCQYAAYVPHHLFFGTFPGILPSASYLLYQ